MPDYATVFLSGYEGGVVVDESALHQTVTKYGTTDLSAAQAKYGTQSLHNPVSPDGSGDRGISVPHHPAMDLGSGEFTAESFVRWEAVPLDTGVNTIIGQNQVNVGGTGISWNLAVRYASLAPNSHGGAVSLYLAELPDDTGEFLECYCEGYSFALNTWYHIAADFDGLFYRVYIQGNLVAFEPAVAWPVAVADSPLTIGTSLLDDGPDLPLYGVYLDETRLIVGEAVYATNTGFTPPTAPHPRPSSGTAPPDDYAIGGTPANPSCDHNLHPPDPTPSPTPPPTPTPSPTPTPTPPSTTRVFKVQNFETGTAPGTYNYTTSELGGRTPKAVVLLGSRHRVANDPNEDEYFGICVGMVDDSGHISGKMVVGTFCHTAVTTGFTTGLSSALDQNGAYYIVNSGAGIDKRGNGYVIPDGLQIGYSENSGTNRRGAFMAFAGSDVTAYARPVILGSGTSAIDVWQPGFTPDFVLFMSDNATMYDSTSETKMTFGIATKDGTQRCVALAEGQFNVSMPFTTLFTDCVVAQIAFDTGVLNYKVSVSDFDSTGFSVTPSASAGGDELGYLAVKLNGGHAKIIDLNTPTVTGNYTITGAGFTPSAAIIVLTNLELTDDRPATSSANQCGFAIGLVSDEGWSAGGRIKFGVSPQETRVNFSNKAIIGPSNTSCNAIEATLVGFTSDGMTLNFTSVQATAKKGFILFIE